MKTNLLYTRVKDEQFLKKALKNTKYSSYFYENIYSTEGRFDITQADVRDFQDFQELSKYFIIGIKREIKINGFPDLEGFNVIDIKEKQLNCLPGGIVLTEFNEIDYEYHLKKLGLIADELRRREMGTLIGDSNSERDLISQAFSTYYSRPGIIKSTDKDKRLIILEEIL